MKHVNLNMKIEYQIIYQTDKLQMQQPEITILECALILQIIPSRGLNLGILVDLNIYKNP